MNAGDSPSAPPATRERIWQVDLAIVDRQLAFAPIGTDTLPPGAVGDEVAQLRVARGHHVGRQPFDPYRDGHQRVEDPLRAALSGGCLPGDEEPAQTQGTLSRADLVDGGQALGELAIDHAGASHCSVAVLRCESNWPGIHLGSNSRTAVAGSQRNHSIGMVRLLDRCSAAGDRSARALSTRRAVSPGRSSIRPKVPKAYRSGVRRTRGIGRLVLAW